MTSDGFRGRGAARSACAAQLSSPAHVGRVSRQRYSRNHHAHRPWVLAMATAV